MDIDLNVSVNSRPDSGSGNSQETGSKDTGSDASAPRLAEELNALEQLLSVGSKIETLDAVHALYCDYARLLGFSAKKGTQSYFTNTLIKRMKVYYCSCEGFAADSPSSSRILKYRKSITRCGCKARLRVIRDEEGPWTVSVFEAKHNHELFPPDYSYLLRSSRNLSMAQGTMFEVFKSRGIGVAKAYSFMEKEANGVQNLNFLQRDAYTHMDRVSRKTNILDSDADSLLKFFIDKNNSEPFFYWNFQRDDDGRLMNFFYRDSRSKEDYAYFGDVILVDTTYRTNKYNLMCAPFVGLNHHRSTAIFGIGFLSDETTETFEWLFSCFLESMNGKEPVVIFTDQCKAMMNAIEIVFESATHRLCQWHICQKTALRFGKMSKDSHFKKLWHICMNGCETVEEFEQNWKEMLKHEQYIDVKWFKKMYTLRRRWASVFTLDKFTAGIHATTRSELANKVLKQCCSSSSTLISFVMNYEELQRTWRRKEGESDALGVWLPGQVIPDCRLLRFAATVYTRAVFKVFERETGLSLCISIKTKPENDQDETLEYTVSSSSSASGERRITVNLRAEEWHCSCKMLETDGIYCRHLIKILVWLNVYHIPEKHILARWRRDARLRLTRPPSEPAPVRPNNSRDNLLLIHRHFGTLWHLVDKFCEDAHTVNALANRLSDVIIEFRDTRYPEDFAEKTGEEPCEASPREGLFRNPRRPVGVWVPGHRGKGYTKPTPRKKLNGTQRKIVRASRFAQEVREKRAQQAREMRDEEACQKRAKHASDEDTSSTLLTQWRREYNVPASSQPIIFNFESSTAFVQDSSESAPSHQFDPHITQDQ